MRYGCMMLKLQVPHWDSILEIIDERDVWYNPDPNGFPKGGKEDNPHITLLYGFHDGVSGDEVAKSIQQLVKDPISLTIKGIGMFEGDDRDVVKFEIESEDLSRINQMLREKFPYSSDFPEYKPHATIAYVKKGEASKYVQELNREIKFPHINLHWSTADESKYYPISLFNRIPPLMDFMKSKNTPIL